MNSNSIHIRIINRPEKAIFLRKVILKSAYCIKKQNIQLIKRAGRLPISKSAKSAQIENGRKYKFTFPIKKQAISDTVIIANSIKFLEV